MSNSDNLVLKYQQKCFREYMRSVGFPEPYTFPDGNPITPLPPIQTSSGGMMIVGAYPSARFESRPSRNKPGVHRLVPIANNLQPFGFEQYFDGIKVRMLESADGLKKHLLNKVALSLKDCWITDIVKVFLYKPEHVDSCQDVHPDFNITANRHLFKEYAEKSMDWLKEEVQLCSPKFIVTLGEEVAKVVSGKKGASADELLSGEISRSDRLGDYPVLHLPHPEACRRSEKWEMKMAECTKIVKKYIS